MKNIFVLTMLSGILSLPLYANEPTNLQAHESIVINAPTDKVWDLVGDFSGIHKWHPAIQSIEMKSDDVRILSLAVDKKITERLLERDEKKMELKYEITDMSVVETFEFAGRKIERNVLPVSNYTGYLSVIPDGQGSKVSWKGEFYRSYPLITPTPEGMSDKDATDTMTSVYQEGLDKLKELMEEGGTESVYTGQTHKQGSPSQVPSSPAIVVATTSSGFDPGNPYHEHIQCEEGQDCKIDKFLLKGFRAFSQCQVCHGIDGNGSTIAPSLLDKMKKEITYDVFVDRVANGFQGQMGVMPPWNTNPNVMKNIDNLYAYLKARADGVIPAGRLERFKH